MKRSEVCAMRNKPAENGMNEHEVFSIMHTWCPWCGLRGLAREDIPKYVKRDGANNFSIKCPLCGKRYGMCTVPQ